MNKNGDIMAANMDGGEFEAQLYRQAEPGLDLSNMDRSYQYSEGDTVSGPEAALIWWTAVAGGSVESSSETATQQTIVFSQYDHDNMQQTQDTELLAQAATGDSAIVADRYGYNHIVSGKLTADGGSELVYLTDKTGEWVEQTVYSQPGVSIGECDIAIGSGGGVHIAFQAMEQASTKLYYTRVIDGWEGSGQLTEILTGGAGVAIDLDKTDGVHMSYLNDQNQVCYWLNGSDGQTEQWVVDERPAGGETMVAATATGGAAVVYTVPDESGKSTVMVKARGDQD